MNTPEVQVEYITIKPQDSAKYLGVFIEKKFQWSCHLQHIESKIAERMSLLRFLFKSATEPNDKTMLDVYEAIARIIIA
jgi:hypothetical protein